jgi:hypothetical protein
MLSEGERGKLAASARVRISTSGVNNRYRGGVLESIIGRINAQIKEYQGNHPWLKSTDSGDNSKWNNGIHENVRKLSLNEVAAACDRLIILGGPGSGKSTFVRYLALCLAGAGLEENQSNSSKSANSANASRTYQERLAELGPNWVHGALTPIYCVKYH